MLKLVNLFITLQKWKPLLHQGALGSGIFKAQAARSALNMTLRARLKPSPEGLPDPLTGQISQSGSGKHVISNL